MIAPKRQSSVNAKVLYRQTAFRRNDKQLKGRHLLFTTCLLLILYACSYTCTRSKIRIKDSDVHNSTCTCSSFQRISKNFLRGRIFKEVLSRDSYVHNSTCTCSNEGVPEEHLLNCYGPAWRICPGPYPGSPAPKNVVASLRAQWIEEAHTCALL